MRYLFYLAHPAHFHLFRHTIEALGDRGHDVLVTIKTKDVLSDLLQVHGMAHVNVARRARTPSRIGMMNAFLHRTQNHWKIARQFRPQLFVSTSAEFAPFARLLGIDSISFFEDDLEHFPVYARTFVPHLSCQVCPVSCSAGMWNGHKKTIKYPAVQELAYLRPERFRPDPEAIKGVFAAGQKNFFLRLSGLTAWHDGNVSGIGDSLAAEIVKRLEPHGQVHISSERPMPRALERYRLDIATSEIFHVLYFADLCVADSQTMTAEAAVLGTPALRFNDFVGRLGYLEELEHRFGLTYGIPTGEPRRLLEKIDELAGMPGLGAVWRAKRDKLIAETIDPVPFFVWFLENYPVSARDASRYLERMKPSGDSHVA